MSPAEELVIAGHGVTARQIAALIDTVVDANPQADGLMIDSLTAIAKLASGLSEDRLTVAKVPSP